MQWSLLFLLLFLLPFPESISFGYHILPERFCAELFLYEACFVLNEHLIYAFFPTLDSRSLTRA